MESDKGWEWSLGHSNRHWGVGCSVTKSCPTLYDPMNCSLPGFPVLHYLLEYAQTHICWVGDYLTISSSVTPFSFCPQSFPASGFFPMSQLFASGGQSIGASTSALVLPMNIQRGKVMSLLLNTLSRLVTDFLPRSKCLLISWLQPPLPFIVLEESRII